MESSSLLEDHVAIDESSVPSMSSEDEISEIETNNDQILLAETLTPTPVQQLPEFQARNDSHNSDPPDPINNYMLMPAYLHHTPEGQQAQKTLGRRFPILGRRRFLLAPWFLPRPPEWLQTLKAKRNHQAHPETGISWFLKAPWFLPRPPESCNWLLLGTNWNKITIRYDYCIKPLSNS